MANLRTQNKLIEIQQDSEKSRLLPSSLAPAEDRVVSALLACCTAVPELLKRLFKPFKVSVTKSAKLCCFSDPPFVHPNTGLLAKPHGLIVISTRSKTWSALILARVADQGIEPHYLDLMFDIARAYKINTIIIFSNLSSHSSGYFNANNKKKFKSIQLYHLSWFKVVNTTIQCLHEINDSITPGQNYLLSELFRYFQDPDSQLLTPVTLTESWSSICLATQSGVNLKQLSSSVEDVIIRWQKLLQYLAFRMVLFLGHTVQVEPGSKYKNNPRLKKKNEKLQLIENHQLSAEFKIPQATSSLKLCVDIKQESLTASMRLIAPKDKQRATTVVTWLLRQLSECSDDDLIVCANWPGGNKTQAKLAEIRADKKVILQPDNDKLPKIFELSKIWLVGNRMRDSKSFVEDAEVILPDFYSEVGQYLKAWTPSPANVISRVPTVKKLAGKTSRKKRRN